MPGKPQHGAENSQSKLTEEDVREIKQRIENGDTNVGIAADYPISTDTVSDIRNGKTWRKVEP